MHYDFERVAMSIPDDLVDETTYRYENKREGTSLLVSTEPPQEKATPALVLGELIEQIRVGCQGQCAVIEERERDFLGGAAKMAALRLGAPGRELSMRMLAAVDARGITLIKLISGEDRAAQFEHIVSSAAPAPLPWSRAGAPGYTRRQAGPFTIEVPSSLAPPASFSFVSRDRAAKIDIRYKTGEGGQEPPPFDDLVALDDPMNETLEVEGGEDRAREVGGYLGRDGSWSLVRRMAGQEVGRYVIRRLTVSLRSEPSLEMLGIAGAGRDAASPASGGVAVLERAWSQAIQTMQRGAT
jgi:hypothetical protein